MALDLGCHCRCSEANGPNLQNPRTGEVMGEQRELLDLSVDISDSPKGPPPQRGMVTYSAELRQAISGPPLRVGQVWHLLSSDGKRFEPATLSLYASGMIIKPDNAQHHTISVAWSPFSLVQACRLHTVQADASRPWLRLFKVSVFHHDTAHLFAAQGDQADSDRARWVADIARALRVLTQSLFPPFALKAEPVQGAGWTSTRLLAGYMLMCEKEAVSVVYCELHTHWDGAAKFVTYEDEYCDTPLLHVSMGVHTSITERVGVDCSCFSVDGHHFSTRTFSEKSLWLRAISNVKVKIRHGAGNPSDDELVHYRRSINESAQTSWLGRYSKALASEERCR